MKTPILPPTHCSCGSPITEITDSKSDVTQHYCENEDCTEQLKARLEYLANRTVLEIDELGPELIEKLVKQDYVTRLSDLFAFANDVLAENFDTLPASVRKMAKSANEAKTRDWDKWIAALDLPNIGRTLGKTLALQLRLQPDDLPNIRTILTKALSEQKIEGIGDIRKAEALDFFAAHGLWFDEEVQALYDAGVRPKALIQAITSSAQPLSGYSICITGEFSEDREKISVKLAGLGASMKSGVSKKLTHLLTGEAPGRSKVAKANELNIPRLDKVWLEKTLTDNGLRLEKVTMEVEDDDFI